MSIALKDFETNLQGGLGTFTHTAGNTGQYYVSCISTVVPPSALSIVINHNGSPVATSVAPSSTSNHVEVNATINTTVGDTLSVVLTSSAPADNVPNLNTVQSLIRVGLTNN
jgi:hypothetical protein